MWKPIFYYRAMETHPMIGILNLSRGFQVSGESQNQSDYPDQSRQTKTT